MKSVTEILGGAQILLGISYDIQTVFEEYLTVEHRGFLASLRIVESHFPELQTTYRGRAIVGHTSRDSTAIAAREAAVNRKKDVAAKKEPKRRRGRPRKDEKRTPKEPTRLARQVRQKPGRSIKELNRSCSWGRKVNSQGNAQFWKGYKLHLDVDDMGIPLTAVVTGANVHDSQLAIPMEKITTKRVQRLYSLMDAAYDAAQIRSDIQAAGGVPIIDANKRRNDQHPNMDPATRRRFRIRSG